jgi:protein-disulfide isomerase
MNTGREAPSSAPRARWRDVAHTGTLLVLAFVAAGALFHQVARLRAETDAPRRAAPPPTPVAGWLELRDAGLREGLASAPFQIVYFSDFQCPACRTMHQRLDSVSRRYGEATGVTMLHFPIESLHPHARTAAVAAECASDQGRFAEFSGALFAAQERIGTTPWEDFAREAAVADLDLFGACLSDEKVGERVRRHEQLGARLGVTGTPTVIVNGLMFDLPPSTAQLDSLASIVIARAADLTATPRTNENQ